MTEEIPSTPGWVDARLDEAFAVLDEAGLDDDALGAARDQYAECLARVKAPAAPSDLEGEEFAPCRADLLAALTGMGVDDALQEELSTRLEAVEAELAEDS